MYTPNDTLIQNLLIEDKKKEDFDQVLVISQSSTWNVPKKKPAGVTLIMILSLGLNEERQLKLLVLWPVLFSTIQ